MRSRGGRSGRVRRRRLARRYPRYRRYRGRAEHHNRDLAGDDTVTTTTTPPPRPPRPDPPRRGKPPVRSATRRPPSSSPRPALLPGPEGAGLPGFPEPDIGPTQVIMQALATGQLAMYPEYLDNWDSEVAGITRRSGADRRLPVRPGLRPRRTVSSCSTRRRSANRGDRGHVRLRRRKPAPVDRGSGRGRPPADPGRAAPSSSRKPTDCRRSRTSIGVSPAAFKPLEIGAQYQALDQGTVQAAEVNTTDPQLAHRRVSAAFRPDGRVRVGERGAGGHGRGPRGRGPGVRRHDQPGSALLTLPQMRELNAAVRAG